MGALSSLKREVRKDLLRWGEEIRGREYYFAQFTLSEPDGEVQISSPRIVPRHIIVTGKQSAQLYMNLFPYTAPTPPGPKFQPYNLLARSATKNFHH